MAVPVIIAVACGVAVARALPRPDGVAALGWWFAVLGASSIALVVVERAARRLLPLAALLKLTLVFPDRAPARMSVAMRSMNLRRLRGWAREVSAADPGADLATRITAVLTLAAALNAHDRRTRGHSERVRALTALVAEEMELDDVAASRLQWAALLHDIGKLLVPREILNKAGDPDEREWHVLHRHPAEGARLAAPLSEWLGPWIGAIGQHHEHYDGTGYPKGLTADEISLGARVVTVTDSFETMTALRSYNRPMSVAAAREELVHCAGRQFDPDIVRAFLNVSLGRLHWTVGVMAWLAEVPLVGNVPRVGALVGNAAGSSAAYGAAVAGVASLVVAAGFSVGGGSKPAEASSVETARAPQATEVLGGQVVNEAITSAGDGVGSAAPAASGPGSTDLSDPLGSGSPTPGDPGTPSGDPAGSPSSDPAGGPGNGKGPPLVPPGLTKPHPPGPAGQGGRDPLPVPISVPGVGVPGGGKLP